MFSKDIAHHTASLSSETHLILKCSTRHKTHKHTSEDIHVTQNISPPNAASPASFPHVFPNLKSLTFIIFRGTMLFSESWQIYCPHCLCLIDLFIHEIFSWIYLFIHAFIPPTLLQNGYLGGLQEYTKYNMIA